MLGDEPKATAESSGVLQPKVMTASELEELKKEAQVRGRSQVTGCGEGSRIL
jgi:hypothetical protein